MTPPPPPSAIYNGDDAKPNGTNGTTHTPHEPGLSESKARVEMPSFPKPPVFDDKYKEREYLKGRLAAAFRIFGKYGYDEGVAGHITLRDPVEPDTFWVNPFGVAFSLINASDLIRVGHDGQVVTSGAKGSLLNAAAFCIHSAIHHARPDVHAAAHSHSIHGRAFSTLGKPIDITNQDSCAFYNDQSLYTNFNGVVLAEKEGQNIASCLGQTKMCILQNHGLLSVGGTVEEAVFWFVSAEKSCHAQLMADAAAGGTGGKTVKVDDEDARVTYNTVGTARAGYFSAKPLFDVIDKDTGKDYLH